jgi:alpha-ketoglutarate-dependent taurine dioxygenase
MTETVPEETAHQPAAPRIGESPRIGENPQIGERLSPAGGVAITGADLSRPLSPSVRDAILAAFRDHHIVVFRDQDLSNEEHLAFTLQFGEIEEHVGRHNAASR